MATARVNSLERFRRLTKELREEVHDEAGAELNKQAEELARLIESVAPHEEGTLKTTVKVVKDQKRDTLVRIVAGGEKTVRKGKGRIRPYDYARADEFGTVNMKPRPFFFPTYRLRKKKIISAMKRRITANIKKRSAE